MILMNILKNIAKSLVILILLALPCITDARPAHRGLVNLRQPDGMMFKAIIRGDEFGSIKTTEEGQAIIQDEGWWCYALYDDAGHIQSSGVKVGEAPAPAGSSFIPWEALAFNRELKKMTSTQGQERNFAERFLPTRLSPHSEGEVRSKHGIVILAQFADVKFRFTREDFINMLTQKNYSYNGAIGSAKEYFDDQFEGMIDFHFDVSPIVTLSGNQAYYGGNNSKGTDKAPAEMVEEACILAAESVDFSLYDDDGDGEVDNVFVFYAGGDEAEGAGEDCIWPHAWYLWNGAGINLSLNGKKINRYACTAELTTRDGGVTSHLCGIGTFCHEYSHTFGLPDLYDTNYEKNGWSAGTWLFTSLMDGGNQNNRGNSPPNYNALEREILGIAEPVILEENGSHSMYPINKKNEYFRFNTDRENEYYLIEFREDVGWDSHIGGDGMLIYHIDKTEQYLTRWSSNDVNSYGDHQCVDLIEADNRSDVFSNEKDYVTSMANIEGVFFPYGDRNSLTADTRPGIEYWSGAGSGYAVTGIKRHLDRMKFNFIADSGDMTPPEATEITYLSFQDAAIINFRSDRTFDGEAIVTWGETGSETMVTDTLLPYQAGRYSLVLEDLEPRKNYTVDIVFEMYGIQGLEKKVTFLTKSDSGSNIPYIYLKGIERYEDGSFPAGTGLPLRLYNALTAEEVRWTYDGKEVEAGSSGYFVPQASGVLKAYVVWPDGSTEVIMKEIIISE